MNNTVVKRYPLSKQVADKLEQMIENGEYAVGEKIHTEGELMAIFNVSRNTVREAIKSLTSAGVLEVKQGDGTYVRSSNRFDANMNLKYEKESLHDISEARTCLEMTIVHLSAERRTNADMERISAAFTKRKELNESIRENTLADIEFHMEIAKACHNKILIDLYQSLYSYLESHIIERQSVTHMNSEQIERLHEELFLAIKNQCPDEASVCVQNILKI